MSVQGGGPPHVGNHWITRFVRRHPEVHKKIGQKMEAARVNGATPEVIEAFLKHYADVKARIGVLPQDTYNMDETGLNLGVCGHYNYIGTSSTTKCLKRTPETREWVSILETVSATGQKLKPLVIFKGGSV